MPRRDVPRPPESVARGALDHPFGRAAVAATGRGVCAIVLRGGAAGLARRLAGFGRLPGRRPDPRAGGRLEAALAWLDALLNRGEAPPPAFALDLPGGTPFQREVWRAIGAIPPGEVRTYGDLAREIGRPRAARAVGAASGANPLPLAVPCHRLLGAAGGLHGYAGGLEMKRWLLRREAEQMREPARERTG
ncbi:MAG: methylated-DNA--[protein]-cysteine S-methyltransferase [bacterium]